MNTNKELERIVSDWLEDRAAPPPRGSLESALARAERTPQRHRWLGRWFGRRSDATRSATDRDTTSDSNHRRNRLMFSATAVATSAAALALAATLVVPQGASDPNPVPGAGGATHRVAADGSGDYETINDALAVAEEGDTILVAPGTYTEYLLIDKNITLAGDGPRDEIVVEFPEGGPASDLWGAAGDPVSFPIVLQGSDAILRGLTIQVPLGGGGVLVDEGAPELADLSVVPHPDATVVVFPYSHPSAGRAFGFVRGSYPVLRNSSWAGILFSGQSSPTIEGNTITAGRMALDGPGEAIVRGNTFLDGAWLGPDSDLTGIIEGNDLGAGVILIGPGSMTVKDNVISGMRPIQYGESAITVEGGGNAHIIGNTVTDSEGGIKVGLGAVATVEGNSLTNNDTAIWWASTKSGDIKANTVSGGTVGIRITFGDPSVVGNTVCGCGTNLQVAKGAAPIIGENEICQDEVAVTE